MGHCYQNSISKLLDQYTFGNEIVIVTIFVVSNLSNNQPCRLAVKSKNISHQKGLERKSHVRLAKKHSHARLEYERSGTTAATKGLISSGKHFFRLHFSQQIICRSCTNPSIHCTSRHCSRSFVDPAPVYISITLQGTGHLWV